MAAAQARGERHRQRARDLGVGEVADVVVLGDDEALPPATVAAVEPAVELEDDRPLLERELRRIRVRDVDDGRAAVGADMAEAAAFAPRSDV